MDKKIFGSFTAHSRILYVKNLHSSKRGYAQRIK